MLAKIELMLSSARFNLYGYFTSFTKPKQKITDEHKAVYGWNPDRFMSWADKTGPKTRNLVKKILESREYPVQSYRTCMGIMRLYKSFSPEIMEAAKKL